MDKEIIFTSAEGFDRLDYFMGSKSRRYEFLNNNVLFDAVASELTNAYLPTVYC